MLGWPASRKRRRAAVTLAERLALLRAMRQVVTGAGTASVKIATCPLAAHCETPVTAPPLRSGRDGVADSCNRGGLT